MISKVGSNVKRPYSLPPVFNNGLKSPCLAERPLSHLLSRVAEPAGLSC